MQNSKGAPQTGAYMLYIAWELNNAINPEMEVHYLALMATNRFYLEFTSTLHLGVWEDIDF